MSNKARIFEVDVSRAARTAFGALKQEKLTSRMESRMAQRMREALRQVIEKTINDSIADGSFPRRSGRGARLTRGGGRAFGTTFSNLRGHILGPGYIKLQEEGGTLYPMKSAALTIPMPDALRNDGSPKLRTARQWGNILPTFVYKSKKTGNAYIAYKNKSTNRLVLLYLLVDAATFKGSHFLRKAWGRNRYYLGQLFGQIMRDEMESVDLLKAARVTHRGKK